MTFDKYTKKYDFKTGSFNCVNKSSNSFLLKEFKALVSVFNKLSIKFLKLFFFFSSSIFKSAFIFFKYFLKVFTTSHFKSKSPESCPLILTLVLLDNSGHGIYGIDSIFGSGLASTLFLLIKSFISAGKFNLLNLSVKSSASIFIEDWICFKLVTKKPKVPFIWL